MKKEKRKLDLDINFKCKPGEMRLCKPTAFCKASLMQVGLDVAVHL